MVRQVDAIFSHGSFRPLEPIELTEGTRVRLRVEDQPDTGRTGPMRMQSPKLANPEDATHFVLDVREATHAEV